MAIGDETILENRVPKGLNVVYVTQEAHFGTVTPGVKIDTIADTTYILNAPVTQTLPLVIPTSGSFQLLTSNKNKNILTYTGGANAQFQGTNIGTLAILDAALNGSSTGVLFDIDGGVISLKFPDFNSYDDIGVFENVNSLYCPGVYFEAISAGLDLIDCSFCTFTDTLIVTNSGNTFTFFNISGASSGDIQIVTAIMENDSFSSFIHVDGATFPSDHTVNIAASNVLYRDNFYGSGSIDQTDSRMLLRGNKGSQDSIVTAEANLNNNALVTDIPAVDAFVVINGTTWIAEEESRILVTSNGDAEYIDFRDNSVILDGNVSMSPLTATKELSARFVQLAENRTTVTFTNATNLINETGTALVNGDEIMFRDTAGTLPAELREDIVYFVVNKLTNSFQVAYTAGGSAITFTDDGTPVNSYALATFHGSTPQNSISSLAPKSVTPQALKVIKTGDKVFLTISNKTDAVNVTVRDAFFRISG
jgi:hypothetical protein